ncbi:hypothetical protein ESZ36_08475 [Colwellia demingiae]|uniref:TniQ domain-containing protein n=1 Tax=Colwellia demingiae TaxID=89401 RepID=A0A5C6QHZ4_9GAMM|nr:TniQ family protein [Colwellia demingiae]TWX68519.1 hypothetical protein ESZ36_08475 [Colwellia demingiae]
MLNNTVEKLEFAVRPRPNHAESAQGFLLRLAVSNGRYELSKLAEAIDYKYKPSSFVLGGADVESFLLALSGALRLSGHDLVSSFSMSIDIEDNRRAVNEIRLPTPKVCPSCMIHDDSRYIKEPWEYAHHTHCEEHNVVLVDRCPRCTEPLSWNGDIFQGCSCCGYRWESYQTVTQSLPIYQTICNELTDLELKEYLAALYQNLIFVSRPFDLSFDKFKQLPKDLINIPYLFELAFQLTISDEAKADWEEMRLSHFKADTNLNSLDDHSLQVLAQLPSSNVSTGFLKDKAQSKPEQCMLPIRQRVMVSSLRIRNSDSVRDYQYQISLGRAAKLLGVDKKTINALVELDLVSAYSGSVASRARIVSGSSVAKLISMIIEHSLNIDNQEDKLISLKELMKGLPYFNCDLSSLVMLIVTNKCQTYLDKKNTFSIPYLFVNREEIAFHLEQYFVESIRYDLSRNKLQQLCILKPHQFIELKNTFNLQETGPVASLAKLNPVQISSFFEQHILINRWAKIAGVKLRSVIQFLKCEPDITSNSILEHQDIYIYEKSDELFDSLTRYLIYHKGEVHFLANICI